MTTPIKVGDPDYEILYGMWISTKKAHEFIGIGGGSYRAVMDGDGPIFVLMGGSAGPIPAAYGSTAVPNTKPQVAKDVQVVVAARKKGGIARGAEDGEKAVSSDAE